MKVDKGPGDGVTDTHPEATIVTSIASVKGEQKQFKTQLLPFCTSEINPCSELLFSPLLCLLGLSLIGLDWNHGRPLIKMINNINNSKGNRKGSLLFFNGLNTDSCWLNE